METYQATANPLFKLNAYDFAGSAHLLPLMKLRLTPKDNARIVFIMGRFARSTTTRARAEIVEPRRPVNSWAVTRQPPRRRVERRNRHNGRLFRLAVLVVLLIIGASAGWLIGRAVIKPSHDKALPSAAVIEGFSHGNSAIDSAAKDTASNEEIAANEQAVAEGGQLSDRDQFERQSNSTGGRRYAKGRGFQPTSIVTKPARVISKPFKKLNPFKLF